MRKLSLLTSMLLFFTFLAIEGCNGGGGGAGGKPEGASIDQNGSAPSSTNPDGVGTTNGGAAQPANGSKRKKDIFEGSISYLWNGIISTAQADAGTEICSSKCTTNDCVTLILIEAGVERVICKTDKLVSGSGEVTYKFEIDQEQMDGKTYKVLASISGEERSLVDYYDENVRAARKEKINVDKDTHLQAVFLSEALKSNPELTATPPSNETNSKSIEEAKEKISKIKIQLSAENIKNVFNQWGLTSSDGVEIKPDLFLRKAPDFVKEIAQRVSTGKGEIEFPQTIPADLAQKHHVENVKKEIIEDVKSSIDTDGDLVVDLDDCAPNDAKRWQWGSFDYADFDFDKYYVPGPFKVCYGTSPPEVYHVNLNKLKPYQDCDDTDSSTFNLVTAPYLDSDKDGYFIRKNHEICVGIGGYGAPLTSRFSYSGILDCNDSDKNTWRKIFGKSEDKDKDGYYVPMPSTQEYCIGSEFPSGVSEDKIESAFQDCNDEDANKYFSLEYWTDTDGDGYTTGSKQVSCGNKTQIPVGASAINLGTDCDDAIKAKFKLWSYNFKDADHDGATVEESGQFCGGDTRPDELSMYRGWEDDTNDSDDSVPQKSSVLAMESFLARNDLYASPVNPRAKYYQLLLSKFDPSSDYDAIGFRISKMYVPGNSNSTVDTVSFVPINGTQVSGSSENYFPKDLAKVTIGSIVDFAAISGLDESSDIYLLTSNSLYEYKAFRSYEIPTPSVYSKTDLGLPANSVDSNYNLAVLNTSSGARNIYVARFNSVAFSKDSGKTWKSLSEESGQIPNMGVPLAMKACLVDDKAYVYLLQYNRIWITHDDFTTVREVAIGTNGLNVSRLWNFAISGCGDSAKIYVTTDSQLAVSSDEGKSFEILPESSNTAGFSTVTVGNDGTQDYIFLGGAAKPAIAISQNGKTFLQKSLPKPAPYISVTNYRGALLVVAAGEGVSYWYTSAPKPVCNESSVGQLDPFTKKVCKNKKTYTFNSPKKDSVPLTYYNCSGYNNTTPQTGTQFCKELPVPNLPLDTMVNGECTGFLAGSGSTDVNGNSVYYGSVKEYRSFHDGWINLTQYATEKVTCTFSYSPRWE